MAPRSGCWSRKIQNSRQFGKRAVAISGRGIAAELASPYATASHHTNAATLTAQQLIDAALEYTGYTQGWDITDWSVPSGILSLQGAPADVVLHIAEAAGRRPAVRVADQNLAHAAALPGQALGVVCRNA